MKTSYVTLKQAEQLKKLKMNCTPLIEEGIAKAYGKKGDDVNWTTGHFHCWKPSFDYTCKWLRENFDIHITPNATYNKYGAIYMCTVFYIHNDRVYIETLKDKPLTIDCVPPKIFDTYELAQSAGLDYTLKLISKNKFKIITKVEKEKRLRKIEKYKKEDKQRSETFLKNLRIVSKRK